MIFHYFFLLVNLILLLPIVEASDLEQPDPSMKYEFYSSGGRGRGGGGGGGNRGRMVGSGGSSGGTTGAADGGLSWEWAVIITGAVLVIIIVCCCYIRSEAKSETSDSYNKISPLSNASSQQGETPYSISQKTTDSPHTPVESISLRPSNIQIPTEEVSTTLTPPPNTPNSIKGFPTPQPLPPNTPEPNDVFPTTLPPKPLISSSYPVTFENSSTKSSNLKPPIYAVLFSETVTLAGIK